MMINFDANETVIRINKSHGLDKNVVAVKNE